MKQSPIEKRALVILNFLKTSETIGFVLRPIGPQSITVSFCETNLFHYLP